MARRHEPRPDSLRRKVGTRPPRKTLVLFCEGDRSEPDYFAALRTEPQVRDHAAVDIHIDEDSAGHDPLDLVHMAIAARERAREEEGEVDEFWCVFDVEWTNANHNHPRLPEAVRVAKRNGILLAISNPCFEVWLILHFENVTRWLNNDEARRRRRHHDGQADKGVIGSLYMPRRLAAARHARALEKKHRDDGTAAPHDNPSSGVFRIIESVSALLPDHEPASASVPRPRSGERRPSKRS